MGEGGLERRSGFFSNAKKKARMDMYVHCKLEFFLYLHFEFLPLFMKEIGCALSLSPFGRFPSLLWLVLGSKEAEMERIRIKQGISR